MDKLKSVKEELKKRFLLIRMIIFDFDGVFTDNAVWVTEDGKEIVRCSRGDGIGLQKLSHLGIESLVISTETNPVVTVRARKLKLRCIQGCENKLEAMKEIASEYGLELSQIAFVGNDINDLECLQSAGLPIVVKDAHADVMNYAAYVTNCRGGYGAVREICDLLDDIFSMNKKV